jgi:hypothetical protein
MKMFIRMLFSALLGALIVFLAMIGFEDSNSRVLIDKDLGVYSDILNKTKEESDLYSGGIVKDMIDLRAVMYENLIAALNEKRASFAHRFNMSYVSNATVESSHKSISFDEIDKDIDIIKAAIQKSEVEASMYSGGFVLSLILMRKAQEEITLAALEHRKMAAKYGFPVALALGGGAGEKGGQAVSPPDPSKDKDAL